MILEESYSNAKEEAAAHKKKLKKIMKQYKKLKDERANADEMLEREKDMALEQAREALKEVDLYKRICNMFLMRSDFERIVQGSYIVVPWFWFWFHKSCFSPSWFSPLQSRHGTNSSKSGTCRASSCRWRCQRLVSRHRPTTCAWLTHTPSGAAR